MQGIKTRLDEHRFSAKSCGPPPLPRHPIRMLPTGGSAMSAAANIPAKQMQSEESLPALDDEERRAVQTRVRERLHARASPDAISPATVKSSARTPGAKTPKSGRNTPGYMTPKSTNRSKRGGAISSRSSALTNRTSSPTGRYHPDPERRLDIRKVPAFRPHHSRPY